MELLHFIALTCNAGADEILDNAESARDEERMLKAVKCLLPSFMPSTVYRGEHLLEAGR
jgi:hypothetical protein